MSIVAVAILISFHLKAEASALEKRIALPFGLVFWILAIACLAAGLNNYIKTVSRYSRRQALVQSGTGTQLVSAILCRDEKRRCWWLENDADTTVNARSLLLWRQQSSQHVCFSCRRMLETANHAKDCRSAAHE
jgi:hypothetical protein